MFDWLTADESNAVTMLKHDHDKVKDLFDRFEKAEHQAEKKKIAKQALEELRIHAALEEEIFYPAVREHMARNEMNDIMNEADEEHHVAKVLIAELTSMDGTGDHFEAKFTVLAENVRHHIKEEENDMFPKVKALDLDMKALGHRMDVRKRELKSEGVPATPEDRMVAGKPARKKVASRTRKPALAKSK